MSFLMRPSMARLAAAALSGVLLALALPSWSFAPLAWAALVPLIVAAFHAESVWEAARLGFAALAVSHALAMPWLVHVMTRFGGISLPVSVLVALLLIGYLALYGAAFGAFVKVVTRRGGAWTLLLAPAAWTTLEWIRGWMFTGFPWNPLALTQYRNPEMIQSASAGGIYAVTFLLAAANALFAMAALAGGWKRRAGFAAAALAVPLFAFAHGRLAMREELPSRSPVRVGVVQANIPQEQKISRANVWEALDKHVRLSREAAEKGATHIVWPEAVIPLAYGESSPYQRKMEALSLETKTFHTFGTVSVQGDALFNTALTLSPAGKAAGRYDKTRLVPFGEYVPLRKVFFFAAPLVKAVGRFEPGARTKPAYIGHAPFGVSVCYEIVFPEHARAWADLGAEYLVTITNDAWFGRSATPWQHFAHAVFRAVETRRFVVRAANTGVSGFVDPFGRVLQESALFEEAALVENVRPVNVRSRYVRWGDWLPRACLYIALGALAWTAWPRVKRWLKKRIEKPVIEDEDGA